MNKDGGGVEKQFRQGGLGRHLLGGERVTSELRLVTFELRLRNRIPRGRVACEKGICEVVGPVQPGTELRFYSKAMGEPQRLLCQGTACSVLPF